MWVVISYGQFEKQDGGRWMVPGQLGWQPTGVKVPTNGVFCDRADAKRFAEHCAGRYPGTKFALFALEGAVVTAEPPIKWTEI
jgi:hypothetical protein